MRLTTALLVGSVLAAAPGLAEAQSSGQIINRILSVLDNSTQDEAITRAFRDTLDRNPTTSELRRYRGLMQQSGWTEAEVRQDLRDRVDYRRYNRTTTDMNPSAIVSRAYEDILGRSPSRAELGQYRSRIIEEGWTERDVRDALRGTSEFSGDRRTVSADRIVRRAYRDILHREPDPEGLEEYRHQILDNGWDEQDVRRALRRSDERRGLARVSEITDAQANEMVRRAYLSVLNREPDASGLKEYKRRILTERWTEQQVMDALRKSDEYRMKHR